MEEYINLFEKIIEKTIPKVDYIDVRAGMSDNTSILMKDGKVDEINTGMSLGARIRVLNNNFRIKCHNSYNDTRKHNYRPYKGQVPLWSHILVYHNQDTLAYKHYIASNNHRAQRFQVWRELLDSS